MLTKKEEAFIKYWSENRELQKKSFTAFLKGFSSGLIIGIGILLLISVGWYQRANMVANTMLNPFILLLVILILSVFMAFFYKNYRWEMNDQQYLELLAKKKKQKEDINMQQDQPENGQ